MVQCEHRRDDMKKGRVLLGMSGGVDSSVSALLLKNEGYEVIGVTLSLSNHTDAKDAKDVCDKLGIEHISIDMQESFKKYVIDNFIDCYANALTPNPCIECNRKLKFGEMYKKAKELNCDFLATGHYAKIEYDNNYNQFVLRKCLNENDIDNIKRINTLFDSDLESYNKDVDAEYIGKKVSSCMNSKYSVEDLLDESAIFLHTFLLLDKKSAEKILLEMIKNNVLIINYMEKMNELYNDKLLTVEVESDNYNLEYVKKYLENHDIDKLPYDLIYQINANNVIFYKLNSEIYNISVSDDKEKMLDSVKKYELKDK